MSSNDIDRVASYGRDRDRACRQEAELPPSNPRPPTPPSATVADLEAFANPHRWTPSAAEAQRVRGDSR